MDDKMSAIDAADEAGWVAGASEENNYLDTLVGFASGITDFLQEGLSDLTTSTVAIATSIGRILSPSTDPNLTSAQIEEQQLLRDISRGLIISSDEALDRFEAIAQSSKPGMFNYTTLSNLFDGARTFVPAFGLTTSLGVSIFGAATGNEDLQNIGDISGGMFSILQGAQTFGNQALINASTSTVLGRLFTPLAGLLGAVQYASSAERLITDTSINPSADGQFNYTTWIERVGVMTTGIGGAFVAAGAITAFIPGGQPVAAVLLPAGAIFMGAGAIMQNAGAIQSIINELLPTQSVPPTSVNLPIHNNTPVPQPAPIQTPSIPPTPPTETPTP
ncbi:MAG: hypothetical protein IT310_01800 [Anaerolineales bacterium]|nr:hypothetical protein [Anaerolineales bacterium]